MSDTSIVPPHDLDAEQAVLGAVLLSDGGAMRALREVGLMPKHFYRDTHRVVFEAMCEMEAVDGVLLVAHLRDTARLAAAGGRAAIDLHASSTPAAGHYRHYARVVIDCWRLRMWLRAAGTITLAVAARDEARLAKVAAWCAGQVPEDPS